MTARLLTRLRGMDRDELTFRAAAAIRNRVGRARTMLATPGWRREGLRLSDIPELEATRAALQRGDWRGAHRLLASHVATRPARFPLDPRRLDAVAADVRVRFAAGDAAGKAERLLGGYYDLLGYRSVRAGSPPQWHTDHVHGRRAPLLFWDRVPYLDAACGDHKITWEINRHQHFLALGRAYALTKDDRFYQAFVLHLTDWIRENPPLMGTNWASMLELAFRCFSWLWALHFFAPAASDSDVEPWTVDLLLALDRQLEHVSRNLSRYFSPNTHLSGEALALYVGGRALPELASAPSYETVGRDVLLAEAHRQVLPDGGHAERSPHYHRYSTDFYLLACHTALVSGDPAASLLRDAAYRQARFLRAVADDAGRLPQIGDDDGGQLFPICGRPPSDARDTLATAAVLLDDPRLAVGPIPEETWWRCGTTIAIPEISAPGRVPSVAFDDTGYCVARDGDGNHLVFDCGAHGYLNAGHAHADALSIVATAGNRPLLIDPGTATYTMDLAARDRFRSTAMHNTVIVEGRQQSEPRGPFHWKTTTDAERLVWSPGARGDYAEARHDGYAPIVHTRSVFALHGIGWIVIDHLLGGAAPVPCAVMWHVHPQWKPVRSDSHRMTFLCDDGAEASMASSAPLAPAGDAGLNEYAPEYGRIEPALCVMATIPAAHPAAVATFIAASATWQARSVRAIEIDRRPDAEWHAAGFRIETARRSLTAWSCVPASTGAASGAGPATPWGGEGLIVTGRAGVLLHEGTGVDQLIHVAAGSLASSMHPAERF